MTGLLVGIFSGLAVLITSVLRVSNTKNIQVVIFLEVIFKSYCSLNFSVCEALFKELKGNEICTEGILFSYLLFLFCLLVFAVLPSFVSNRGQKCEK